jgi:protein involved in polysaccharide export with SLBB domain
MPRKPSRALARVMALICCLLIAAAGGVPAAAQVSPAQTALDSLLKRGPSGDRSVAREGQATQAEGGPVAQTAVGKTGEAAKAAPEPFGASLFAGAALSATDVVNPDYKIQPGDRISLYVWGGLTSPETVQAVDPGGNINVPEHGPVHVAGVRAGDLRTYLQQQTAKSFTSSVSIYAVVMTSQRVGVLVTGFVKHPGRYGGGAADTVLDYLIRAGGVDPSRGSYRSVAVLRQGRPIADIDLYQFLLSGRLPQIDFQEGDTVVVAPQRAMVLVDGAVRNDYLFEIAKGGAPGQEILTLASPLPSATNAVIRGTRESQPFSQYVTLDQLRTTEIFDQDQITFVTDTPAKSVRVQVQGSRIGPSVLVVGTDARLPAVLRQVKVDPALADVNSAYVLRRSVALQQKHNLAEAMDQLERSLFLARSATTGVATIRASEAQLVESYLQRARRTEPEGLLVVSDQQGGFADLRMEEDDVIVIPKRSQLVMVSGEVRAPQAIVFKPGLSRDDYVRRAGGYGERGGRHFIIRHANGEAVLDRDAPLRAGDELIVVPEVGTKWFQLGTDFVSLAYQIAIGAQIFGVR